jgi:hypothetical protein
MSLIQFINDPFYGLGGEKKGQIWPSLLQYGLERRYKYRKILNKFAFSGGKY